MRFSTSLVLFAAIITGAFQKVPVSATPYGSRALRSDPSTSGNPTNSWEEVSAGELTVLHPPIHPMGGLKVNNNNSHLNQLNAGLQRRLEAHRGTYIRDDAILHPRNDLDDKDLEYLVHIIKFVLQEGSKPDNLLPEEAAYLSPLVAKARQWGPSGPVVGASEDEKITWSLIYDPKSRYWIGHGDRPKLRIDTNIQPPPVPPKDERYRDPSKVTFATAKLPKAT
ncbi:hypothetical protein BC835DRAFT_1354467 [Cytidiella melzeri]|nr:hypothetical protein BC835DRAFT_1354467 [Cytidiella melzeri]